MTNKVLIGVIVVLVIVGGAFYMLQSNPATQTALNSDSSSFENDAAAILSLPNISAQAKIDQLNANLRARIASRQLQAARAGVNLKTIPPTTIPVTTTTVKK
jgi:hypothetical protein